MGLIWALLIGLVVGVIAKFLMPGRDPGGAIITILLGVAGSAIAFVIGRATGAYDQYGEGPGIIASVIGAMLVLGVYRMAIGRRRTV